MQDRDGSAQELVVQASSPGEASALARNLVAARAPGATVASCAIVRAAARGHASTNPRAATAARRSDVADEPSAHRWRGAAVPGQELMAGETPEDCIIRLNIPTDDKLEALCRPGTAGPSPR